MIFRHNSLILSLSFLLLIGTSLAMDGFLQAGGGRTFFVTDDIDSMRNFLGKDIAQDHINKVLDDIQAENNGTCINHKTGLSTKDQLLEFIQGPCSPLIVSPGLFASKLTVQIDCQTLREQSKEAFDSCGWIGCEGIDAPKKDYIIWIAEFQGRLDPFLELTTACWGNLIKLNYDASEPDIRKKFQGTPGAHVVPYGVADAYKSKAQCGFGAANDIFPLPIQEQETIGWKKVMQRFESLGYQLGLTLYCVPYDWRQTSAANGVGIFINETVKQAYNLTGKPSVLASHSLGNLGMMYALNRMSLEQKQKMVANWVAFFPPLPGAGKILYAILGGDQTFVINEFLQISANSQKKLMHCDTSSTDLYYKDIMEEQADQQWLQDWKQRQDLENLYDPTTPEGKAKWEEIVQSGNYTLKYFPTPLTDCSKDLTGRPDYCRMGTYNWSADVALSFQIDGNTLNYTASSKDREEVMSKYNGLMPDFFEFYNLSNSNNIKELNNPQVPVTLVFGTHLNTDKGGVYRYDPKKAAEEGKHGFPNQILFTPGDEVVPATSSLIPGFKWAWEFENNGAEGAYPIKFVEFCAIHNQRGTIYDEINENEPYSVKNVEYIGLDCDCLTGAKTSGEKCNHAVGPQDKKFIDFLANVAYNNFKNPNYQNTGGYILSNEQLQELQNNCPAMNYSDEDTLFNRYMKQLEAIEL